MFLLSEYGYYAAAFYYSKVGHNEYTVIKKLKLIII